MISRIQFCVLLLIASFAPDLDNVYANVAANTPQTIDYIASLEDLIDRQETDPSLLDIKLTIDSLIDPDMDAAATRSLIMSMVEDVEAMLRPSMEQWDRMIAVRAYLYDPGWWNDEKTFSYDHDDPLGLSGTSRLLHNYIDTRKGNCVSMPVLQAILGQAIGLDMRLSTAPEHIFIKYTNAAGETINLEATSGG